MGEGEDKALVVFRTEEHAKAYQESTGKHTEAEGFRVAPMDREAIEGALEMCVAALVAMPQTWHRELERAPSVRVDTFTAENFLRPGPKEGETWRA